MGSQFSDQGSNLHSWVMEARVFTTDLQERGHGDCVWGCLRAWSLSWIELGEGSEGARKEVGVRSNEAQQLPKTWLLSWKCLLPCGTVKPAEARCPGTRFVLCSKASDFPAFCPLFLHL